MTKNCTQPLRIGNIRALNGCAGRLFGAATLHNHKNSANKSNKYEVDRIKNEDARVLTRVNVFFFRHSRAANSEVSGGILTKFELIQAFIVVLVTCKNEEFNQK